jgi:hypothetical protein
MYELLIKEGAPTPRNDLASRTGKINNGGTPPKPGASLISLLIQFHKLRDEYPHCIILIHQRIRFSRIKANNYLLLRFRIVWQQLPAKQAHTFILTQKLKHLLLGGNLSRISIY